MTGELTQEISVPLHVGDRVTLYEDVDMGDDGGFIGTPLFEGTVTQYNPNTGLLRFEENNVGRAAFLDKLDGAEGIEIV